MKEYVVALEVIDGKAIQWIAPWPGDPGRTSVEKSAKRYQSISSATFGLANARKYRDFLTAEIKEASHAAE
jgi:hypothetical protein